MTRQRAGEDEDVAKEEENGGVRIKQKRRERPREETTKAKSQTGDVLDLRSRSAEIRN